MELTPQQESELAVLIASAWQAFIKERPSYKTIQDFYIGAAGVPSAPEGATDRLCEIAKNAVDNVLPLAVDALSTPLSVVGFRTSESDEDVDVFSDWQSENMDARQTDIYRDTAKFGKALGFETVDGMRYGSPLDSYAAYKDYKLYDYPEYGFVLAVDETGPEIILSMTFYDATTRYDLEIWKMSREVYDFTGVNAFVAATFAIKPILNDHNPHGYDHCPIYKFGDGHPALTGDVLRRQTSINSSVYNRDVCEEFAAFPQKAIIGWDGTASQKAKAGMTQVMAFKDPPGDVSLEQFAAAELAQFSQAVTDKKLSLAQAMQVSPVLLVAQANMAADMIALANAPYERKLGERERGLGEDWERWLRDRAARDGIDVPDDAEVVWDETQPRSFAAVVDGITKIAAIPNLTETLAEEIPGWTQAKAKRYLTEQRKARSVQTLTELAASVPAATGVTDNGQ